MGKFIHITPEIRFLMNLESNASYLLKKYGARECRWCGEVKINCAPFFINEEICLDCEEKMYEAPTDGRAY